MSEVLPVSLAIEPSTSGPAPSEKASTLPFGKLPHGIGSDPRITNPTDLRLLMALLYFAYDSGRCTMADWRLADYANVSDQTVTKSLGRLKRLGLIAIRRFKPHPGNMTGREVILKWYKDPAILAMPPDRKAGRGQTRGSLPADGPSAGRDGVPTGVGIGSLLGEGQGPYAGRDKEEALKEIDQDSVDGGRPPSTRNNVVAIGGQIASASEDDRDGEPSSSTGDDPVTLALRDRLRTHLEAMTSPPQGGRSHPQDVDAAARILARLLLDDGSLDFYRKACWRVARGEITAAMVLGAFDAAYDHAATRRVGTLGSYFVGALRNLEADRVYTEEVEPELRQRAMAGRDSPPEYFEAADSFPAAREQRPSRAEPTEVDADRAERELMAILAEVVRQRDTIDRAGVERAAERIDRVLSPGAGGGGGEFYWHLLEAVVNGYAPENVSRHIADVRKGRRSSGYCGDRPTFGCWWLYHLRPAPQQWKSTPKRQGSFRAIFDWKGIRAAEKERRSAEVEARRSAREARRQAKLKGV